MVESLSAAVEKAVIGWDRIQSILSEAQNLITETRQAAVALQKELVLFRRSLRQIVGCSHRDYRTLRADLVRDNGDDADADESEDPNESDDDSETTVAATSTATAAAAPNKAEAGSVSEQAGAPNPPVPDKEATKAA